MGETVRLRTIAAIPVGRHPDGIAIDADHSLAYIANFYDGTVSVVDLRRRSVVQTTAVGERPYDVVVDAGRDVVYVSQWQGHELWRLDRQHGGAPERIDVGYYDGTLALDVNANRLYLIEPGALAPAIIKAIDGERREVVARFSGGSDPRSLAVDAAHGVLHVLNGGHPHATVVALDDATFRPLATAPIGPWPATTPCTLAVDSTHPRGVPVVYAVHGRDDAVYVVDGGSYDLLARLKVGSRPRGIAIDPVQHLIYVTNWDSNTLTVIDPIGFRVVATWSVGRGPHGVAVDPASRLACVTNNWDNSAIVLALDHSLEPTGPAR